VVRSTVSMPPSPRPPTSPAAPTRMQSP
jgi:hypothetical protein